MPCPLHCVLPRGMVLTRDGGVCCPNQPRDGDVSYLNQLLILALLGWLFQVRSVSE